MALINQVERIILAKTAIRSRRTGSALGNRGPIGSRGIIYNDGVDLISWIDCLLNSGLVSIPIPEFISPNSSIMSNINQEDYQVSLSTETSIIPTTSDITLTDPDGNTGIITLPAGTNLQDALQWLADQISDTEIQISDVIGDFRYDPASSELIINETSDGGQQSADLSELVPSLNTLVTGGNPILEYQLGTSPIITVNETETSFTETSPGIFMYTSESGVSTGLDITGIHELATINSPDSSISVVSSGVDNQTFDVTTNASSIPYVPIAPLTSTNVEDAINELASSSSSNAVINSPNNTLSIVVSGADNEIFDIDVDLSNLVTLNDITLVDPDGITPDHVYAAGGSLEQSLQWLADMIQLTEIQISSTSGIELNPASLILTVTEDSDGGSATVDLSELKQWSDGVTITGSGTTIDPFVATLSHNPTVLNSSDGSIVIVPSGPDNQTFDITVSTDIDTVVTPTLTSGNQIASVTQQVGAPIVEVYETDTTLIDGATSFTYNSESNTVTEIDKANVSSVDSQSNLFIGVQPIIQSQTLLINSVGRSSISTVTTNHPIRFGGALGNQNVTVYVSDRSVVFDQPFNTIPVVTATFGELNTGGHASIHKISVNDISATGFTLRIFDYQNSDNIQVNWIAIGS